MSLRFAMVLLLALGFGVTAAEAGSAGGPAFEHGGGCRKDSPPGRCCHMDHSTGVVHCH